MDFESTLHSVPKIHIFAYPSCHREIQALYCTDFNLHFMDKKTYLVIVIMLVVVLGIAIFGWAHARNELVSLRINDYGQYEKNLEICERIQTEEEYRECVDRLEDFGKTLAQYETFLEKIQTSAFAPRINVSTSTPTSGN